MMTHPMWVRQITNDGLIDAFCDAMDASETGNDDPDLMGLIKIFSDEIYRRERSGMLTEDDWINPVKEKSHAKTRPGSIRNRRTGRDR
jgi:hypothetical protein